MTLMDQNVSAQKEDHKEDHKIELLVMYNGVTERLKVKPDETIALLLTQAIKKFEPLPQPHTLALYRDNGEEITNEAQSVRDTGLKDGEQLLLRPSKVKGG